MLRLNLFICKCIYFSYLGLCAYINQAGHMWCLWMGKRHAGLLCVFVSTDLFSAWPLCLETAIFMMGYYQRCKVTKLYLLKYCTWVQSLGIRTLLEYFQFTILLLLLHYISDPNIVLLLHYIYLKTLVTTSYIPDIHYDIIKHT